MPPGELFFLSPVLAAASQDEVDDASDSPTTGAWCVPVEIHSNVTFVPSSVERSLFSPMDASNATVRGTPNEIWCRIHRSQSGLRLKCC